MSKKTRITDMIRWKAELTRSEFMTAHAEDIPDSVERKAQAMQAALDEVYDDIVNAFLEGESAMLRIAMHLHKDDNAVLIALAHDSEASAIVEHGDNMLAPFKAHINRMLDREYERIGWDGNKGAMRIERVIKGAIDQWKREYSEDGE